MTERTAVFMRGPMTFKLKVDYDLKHHSVEENERALEHLAKVWECSYLYTEVCDVGEDDVD